MSAGQSQAKVLDELSKILASPQFRRSPRLSQFLRHVVEAKLSGNEEQIKESTIGVEVFGKESGYDPKVEPVVRVQARRLREKLAEYYSEVTQPYAWRIEIPKGGYIPEFLGPPIRRWNPWGWWAAAAIVVLATAGVAARGNWQGGTRDLAWEVVRQLDGDKLHPAIHPDGERLAFVWKQPQRVAQIYALQIGGTEPPTRLWDGGEAEFRPVWSPNGKTLAYLVKANEFSFHLRLWEEESNSVKTICQLNSFLMSSGGATGLSWTPDGKEILASHQPHPELPAYLARIDVATGVMQRITNPPTASSRDLDARVSPDGRKIAFQRGQFGELWLAKVGREGSSGERKLGLRDAGLNGFDWLDDDLLLASQRLGGKGRKLSLVHTSKDTTEIVRSEKARIRDLRRGAAGEVWGIAQERDTNIWEVPLSKNALPRMLIGSDEEEWGAVSSAKGDIAFFRHTEGGPQIWLANAEGKQQRQLLQLPGPMAASDLRWHPSGQRVIFHGRMNGNSDLFEVALAKPALKAITSGNSREISPEFSLDGDYLYFVSDRNGLLEPWRLTLKDGRVTPVAAGPALRCQEVPDGSFVCSRLGQGMELVHYKAGRAQLVAKDLPVKSMLAWTLHRDDVLVEALDGEIIRICLKDGRRESVARLLNPHTEMEHAALTIGPAGESLMVVQEDIRRSELVRTRIQPR